MTSESRNEIPIIYKFLSDFWGPLGRTFGNTAHSSLVWPECVKPLQDEVVRHVNLLTSKKLVDIAINPASGVLAVEITEEEVIIFLEIFQKLYASSRIAFGLKR